MDKLREFEKRYESVVARIDALGNEWWSAPEVTMSREEYGRRDAELQIEKQNIVDEYLNWLAR